MRLGVVNKVADFLPRGAIINFFRVLPLVSGSIIQLLFAFNFGHDGATLDVKSDSKSRETRPRRTGTNF